MKKRSLIVLNPMVGALYVNSYPMVASIGIGFSFLIHMSHMMTLTVGYVQWQEGSSTNIKNYRTNTIMIKWK